MSGQRRKPKKTRGRKGWRKCMRRKRDEGEQGKEMRKGMQTGEKGRKEGNKERR